VERQQKLGGNAVKLHRTFPDMEPAADFMNRKIAELMDSPWLKFSQAAKWLR
jgi:heterodisulfide reductase subunit A-like polyferredoxin